MTDILKTWKNPKLFIYLTMTRNLLCAKARVLHCFSIMESKERRKTMSSTVPAVQTVALGRHEPVHDAKIALARSRRRRNGENAHRHVAQSRVVLRRTHPESEDLEVFIFFLERFHLTLLHRRGQVPRQLVLLNPRWLRESHVLPGSDSLRAESRRATDIRLRSKSRR